MKNNKKKSKRGRHGSAINLKRYFQVLGITLSAILVIALGCMALDVGNFSDETTEPVQTAPIEGGKINVLLMGVDNAGLRTDAIMLASYDTDTNQVQMLSIPRDTRMYIGSRYQKINAAHAITGGTGKIAGAQGTIEAVSRLTAVPINYYVEFSFDAIAKCMDQLGTVTFDVPDIEGNGKGMIYDDPVQGLHINIPAGTQELNGEKVVHLLRFRKGNYNKATKSRPQYKNGDLGRIEMQQEFLKALVDQKLNASLILKLPAIFKEVSQAIKTNFTVKDVIKYSAFLNDFTSAGIHTYSLPGNTSGGEYDASYWICDIAATREIIQTHFGYDASAITIDKPGTVSADEPKKDDSNNKQSSKTKNTSSDSSKSSDGNKTSNNKSSNSRSEKSTSKSTSTNTPSKSDSSKSSEKSEASKTSAPSKATSAPSKTAAPAKSSAPSKSDSAKDKAPAAKTATPQKKASSGSQTKSE